MSVEQSERSERRDRDPEEERLREAASGERAWRRFGPYLAERQWGTVREDYSEGGACWDYFPHDHARSRAYRWGEDGLLGLCDDQGRLCFALALWNGRDPILKERLFGLTGPEGNHGEDVKEEYFYLDATPTHSYARALYRYPQAEFPYARLVDEARRRSRTEPELELAETGVFDEGRYFDVVIEYAKAGPDDVLIRVTATNRGPEAATLHVLPTLWFRNTWSWGRSGDAYPPKPRLYAVARDALVAEHATLPRFRFVAEGAARLLFTDNETNAARLFGADNPAAHVKDAFHELVVHGREDAVRSDGAGTKAAALYVLRLGAGESRTLKLRLSEDASAGGGLGRGFDETFRARRDEAERFYAARIPASLGDEERTVARRAYATLLWSKQLFHYDVREWLEGDPAQPPPPASRRVGRNHEWQHLNNFDVVSMPDKWEYPWYAAWDLAFHMIPFARIDPAFAKEQLVLFTREWFMHPNGQLPAYEFAFGDVNPPVHAWSAWRVYESGAREVRDRVFLSRVFQKLLLNFTWWVNRKDDEGRNLFRGGFLGLDNIGVFDRSRPLPTGGSLRQADGTAWMAFYCGTMLAMALELAREDPAGEDMATKFLEHFVAIADAMNRLGGSGLWCERDGFYYDQLAGADGTTTPLRIRSLVGLVPLLACEILEQDTLDRLPDFSRRMRWFLENRPDLARRIVQPDAAGGRWLLAIPSPERLTRILAVMLDEREFLSPHGIRSVSRVHGERPYVLRAGDQEYRVDYVPGESTTGIFGGNSNWRGPVWFPLNYLIVEALERYGRFYGDALRVECPTGSGRLMTLGEVALEIERRLAGLFLPASPGGRRPCDGQLHLPPAAGEDAPLRFHEYFHGETGRGLGASFQGWTTLVARCLEDLGAARAAARRAA